MLSSHWFLTTLLTLKPQFLLGAIPGKSTLTFDFECNAQPQSSTAQIYKGKITFSKKILWVVNVNTTITHRTRNAFSIPPLDGLAGGSYSTNLTVATELDNFDVELFVKYNATFDHIPQFNFIPTVSALDIGGGNVALTLADYKAKYRGQYPPIAPKHSPFHNFITARPSAYNNEEHIEINTRNGNWVATELNGTVATLANLCCPLESYTIGGAGSICSNATYTVTDAPSDAIVTWSAVPSNGVTLNTSGNSCTVTRIGTYNGPITLKALVNKCGYVTTTKTIHIGLPTYTWTNEPGFAIGGGSGNFQCYNASVAGKTFWGVGSIDEGATGTGTWTQMNSIGTVSWGGGLIFNVHLKSKVSGLTLRRTISNSCGDTHQYYTFTSTQVQCPTTFFPITMMESNEEHNIYLSGHILYISYQENSEEEATDKAELSKITISDKMGNVILEKKDASIKSDRIQIDMSLMKSDNYFVVLHYENGNILPKQVSKF